MYKTEIYEGYAKKYRESNIELLRIVAIIMIVASHFSLHGVINNNLLICEKNLMNKLFSCFLLLGNVGVGIFFSVTGYFSSERKKIGNKIIADIIFFTIITCVLMIVFHKQQFYNQILWDKSVLILLLKHIMTPITGENWWFITTYIYLIVFISPCLDRIYASLKKKYKILFIIILLFENVVASYLDTSVNRIFQAATYYLIGKYVREYGIKSKKSVIIIIVVIQLSINMFITYIKYIFGMYLVSDMVLNIIICPSLVFSLMILFINYVKIKRPFCQLVINKWAEATLGIYLLHDSFVMRRFLWLYFMPMRKICESEFSILYSIGVIIFVFGVSSVVVMGYIKYVRGIIIKIICKCISKLSRFTIRNSQ